MIPLPWLLVGVFVLTGTAGVAGYWKGAKDERAAQIEAQHEAVVAGIEAANELATVDLDAAVAAERARRAVAEDRGKRAQSLADALAKAPKPVCPGGEPTVLVLRGAEGGDCRIGPDAQRVLNDAIDAARGGAQSPGRRDGPVPDAGSPQRRRDGDDGAKTAGLDLPADGVREQAGGGG